MYSFFLVGPNKMRSSNKKQRTEGGERHLKKENPLNSWIRNWSVQNEVSHHHFSVPWLIADSQDVFHYHTHGFGFYTWKYPGSNTSITQGKIRVPKITTSRHNIQFCSFVWVINKWNFGDKLIAVPCAIRYGHSNQLKCNYVVLMWRILISLNSLKTFWKTSPGREK